jgi:hypothetical protein
MRLLDGELLKMKHERPNNGFTNSWITPKFIIDDLGPFDLDPCACIPQPWPCAKNQYTIKDDGLKSDWFGRVWLNPPYGTQCGRWLEKLAAYKNGIALIFARTETKMFINFVWEEATALLFIYGRLYFHRPDGSTQGNAGAPSVLVAYNEYDAIRLKESKIAGKYIDVN